MSCYPLLLLPNEIEVLLHGLNCWLGRNSNDALHAAELCSHLQARLNSAVLCHGYTRRDVMRLTGWSREKVRKSLLAIPDLAALPRHGLVPRSVVYSLALPHLTMYPVSLPIPPECPACLVELDLGEILILAQTMADLAHVSSDSYIHYLADWLKLTSETRVSLPLPQVVTRWAYALYRNRVELREQYLVVTRRGVFYRSKIAAGVMSLVEPDAHHRHLHTCHLWRHEVLILGRNTWVVNQTENEILEPPPIVRLLPAAAGQTASPEQ